MNENRFVVCLSNEGYPASLEPRKLYEWLDDPQAESKGMLRIIDESGEDYLYPKAFFAQVAVPGGVGQPTLRIDGLTVGGTA